MEAHRIDAHFDFFGARPSSCPGPPSACPLFSRDWDPAVRRTPTVAECILLGPARSRPRPGARVLPRAPLRPFIPALEARTAPWELVSLFAACEWLSSHHRLPDPLSQPGLSPRRFETHTRTYFVTPTLSFPIPTALTAVVSGACLFHHSDRTISPLRQPDVLARFLSPVFAPFIALDRLRNPAVLFLIQPCINFRVCSGDTRLDPRPSVRCSSAPPSCQMIS